MKTNFVYFFLLSVMVPLVLMAEISDPSLIGYWPLSAGKGDTVFDLSSKKNHGKIAGATWTRDEKGIPVLEFDGLDDYVTVPHADYLNVEDELTLEVWVNLKTANECTPVFIQKGEQSGYSLGYSPYVANAVRFNVSTLNEKGRMNIWGIAIESKPNFLKPDQWHHMVATFSKNERKMTIYCDGEKINEKATNGEKICIKPGKVENTPTPHLLPLRFGALSIAPVHGANMDGYLREIKIYNRALSSAEVKRSCQEHLDIKAIKPIPCASALEASSPAKIKVKIVDDTTGEELNAKIYLKHLGEKKSYYPPGSFVYGLASDDPFFYAFGGFEKGLPPGNLEMWVTHGFEFFPEKVAFELNKGDRKELIVRLKRIINLPSRGWYCGEDELQYDSAHGKGKYYGALTKNPVNPARIAQAEGLDWIHFVHRPEDNAELAKLSTDRFIAINGREGGGRLWGDFIAFTDTTTESKGIFDAFNDVGRVLERGKVVDIADGATLEQIGEPILTSRGRGIPILVAFGKANLLHKAFHDPKQRDVAYRFLNLGFKFASSAGTDNYMTVPAWAINPGWYRAYFKLNKLSWDDLISAYKEQNNFVTDGPLVLASVNGQLPGETIRLSGKKPEVVRLEVEACHVYGMEKVEVVRNGEVIKTLLPENGKILEKINYEVNDTCWLAVRAYGKKGKFFGTFAHTAPFYIQFGDKPVMPRQDDVDYFVQWLENYKKAIEGLSVKNGWKTKDYEELCRLIDEAEKVYQALATAPRRWNDPFVPNAK